MKHRNCLTQWSPRTQRNEIRPSRSSRPLREAPLPRTGLLSAGAFGEGGWTTAPVQPKPAKITPFIPLPINHLQARQTQSNPVQAFFYLHPAPDPRPFTPHRADLSRRSPTKAEATAKSGSAFLSTLNPLFPLLPRLRGLSSTPPEPCVCKCSFRLRKEVNV
jgi:hypothetical protein